MCVSLCVCTQCPTVGATASTGAGRREAVTRGRGDSARPWSTDGGAPRSELVASLNGKVTCVTWSHTLSVSSRRCFHSSAHLDACHCCALTGLRRLCGDSAFSLPTQRPLVPAFPGPQRWLVREGRGWTHSSIRVSPSRSVIF